MLQNLLRVLQFSDVVNIFKNLLKQRSSMMDRMMRNSLCQDSQNKVSSILPVTFHILHLRNQYSN